MSSDEESIPLARRSTKMRLDSDSDDDIPMSSKILTTPPPELSDDSEGEEPIAKTVRRKRPAQKSDGGSSKKSKTVPKEKKAPKKETVKKKTPAKASKTKTPKVAKSKTPTKTPKAKASSQKASKIKSETPSQTDQEEKEEVFRWWEAEDDNDEIKWNTLEHSGVIFPPEYEPLPKGVKLLYDGKPVTLPLEAEEVAGFFGAMIQTDHAANPVFQKNFFEDFKSVLEKNGGCKEARIELFEKCDFSKIFQYYERKKEEKKQLSVSEKKAIKKEKEEAEEKFKTCLLDGRKEQVGNFRIEPPGLFRGRGAHPKTGKLKQRVKPEEVVLNLGKEAPVPSPPAGHNWGEVRHDNKVAWLAMWRENISNSVKYVRFAANSSLKGKSDFKKFEKSRELYFYVDQIRADYSKSLKSQVMFERQVAVATYFIDVFALRAGGEKNDDEADTVGCCSLRYEHVTLKPPNKVIFDFLGKDSIRFYQEVEVDAQVFKNLKIFKKAPKGPGDNLFDRLDPSILNKHFQNYMSGLTAKVFRTYNASKTMQDQLDLIPNEGTVNEKVVKFNAANREVAILCNHQRTISKGHEASVEKINERLRDMVWQRIRIKRMMLQVDKKLLKRKPDFFEELDDFTKEEERTIHQRVLAKEREKIEKKFERDNLKLKEEKEPLMPQSELKERLQKAVELEKEFEAELRTGVTEVKPSSSTVEKLQLQVEKLDQRILNTSWQIKDKEDNAQVALGTSKINYIDPRLAVMFSKKYDVPIEKLFTKTLREKFNWAIESTPADWKFYDPKDAGKKVKKEKLPKKETLKGESDEEVKSEDM